MAYSTLADLINAIPNEEIANLTDDVNGGTPAAATDGAKVTAAIADADGTIDFYCRSRYSVPFTGTIDPAIQRISVDLAICVLFNRRNGPPDNWVKRCDDAIAKLKEIRDGTIQVDTTGAFEIGPASSATEVQPEFTTGKYDVDGNLLGNIMGNWNEEEGSLDDW